MSQLLSVEKEAISPYRSRRESSYLTTLARSIIKQIPKGQLGHCSAASRTLVEIFDEELKDRAQGEATESVESESGEARQSSRSRAIREQTLRRAEGVCDACGEAAPFVDKQNRPLLKMHHLQDLADAGADDPEAVVTICPNCHRRIHYG